MGRKMGMVRRGSRWVGRKWRKRRARISRERAKARSKGVGRIGEVRKGQPTPPPRSRLRDRVPVLTTDAEVVERDLTRRYRDLRVRADRRHTFVCAAHKPPRQFRSAAELANHTLEEHDEPVLHQRGSVAPAKRVRPKATRPQSGRSTNRPDPTGPRQRAPRPSNEERANRLRMGHYMDKIRKAAVSNVGAGNAAAQLGDIGSERITKVSQIVEIGTAIEQLGLAFEEALIGFQQNARTSEEAPIDEEVVSKLTPAVGAAEEISKAALAFLAAFEDRYGDDIRKAQAGERMNNEALTS